VSEISNETADFNLALISDDESLVRTCIEVAQTNLAQSASEYLLGDSALPHVTLCQFQTTSEKLSVIWSAVCKMHLDRILVRFNHIYISAHKGKHWVGLSVEGNDELSKLQQTIFETLGELGIAGTTLPQTYFPHLTWAQCDKTKTINISVIPSAEFWQKEYSFRLSLGRSDPNGVYHEVLFGGSS